MRVTTNYEKHQSVNTFFTISQGGARSGKTYSILQLIIMLCWYNKGANWVITVVRATYGGAKAGPVLDFQKIMRELDWWNWKDWNETNMKYKLFGNTIEFIGADKPDKWRGPQRDWLFINECNHLSWATAWELIVRTNFGVWLDFNPTEEFWVHTEIMQNPEQEGKWTFVHSTVHDNELCPPQIKLNILARAKRDPMYKRIFLDGEIGIPEGLILQNWKIIPNLDDIKGVELIGLDFGYSNDPAAAVRVILNGDDMYVDEMFYKKAMLNEHIAKQLWDWKHLPVIADSSEPKSIAEIQMLGVPMLGVKKGPDSVLWGTGLLQSKNIHITERSMNIQKELRSWKWATDSQGRTINVPLDKMNHSIDAMRYALMWWTDQNMNRKYYTPVKPKLTIL
jgi:phage terminase large subunit